MRLLQTLSFKKAIKKLQPNQKKEVDAAIRNLTKDPLLGEEKKGDLTGVRVYKFRISQQLTLLAYSFNNESMTLTLLAFGSHENFYRDLKRS